MTFTQEKNLLNRIPYFNMTLPTETSVRAWVRKLAERGLAFHFDDDPAEMIDYTTKKKTFTKREAIRVARIIARIREAGLIEAAFQCLVEQTTGDSFSAKNSLVSGY